MNCKPWRNGDPGDETKTDDPETPGGGGESGGGAA